MIKLINNLHELLSDRVRLAEIDALANAGGEYMVKAACGRAGSIPAPGNGWLPPKLVAGA